MNTPLEVEAREVLDSFLFEDVYNNNNYSENEWAISFAGNNYLLYHYATQKTVNIKVVFEPGDLAPEEIQVIMEEQEWEV